MDLKYNATVELSPDDVKKIIEEAVLSQMRGFAVKNVTFEAGMSYHPLDRGPGSPVFKGVKVSLTPKMVGND